MGPVHCGTKAMATLAIPQADRALTPTCLGQRFCGTGQPPGEAVTGAVFFALTGGNAAIARREKVSSTSSRNDGRFLELIVTLIVTCG
jgi:hypothetical protein